MNCPSYPYSIQNELYDHNGREQCNICCCIPLYFYNCGFKLGFFRNSSHYYQAFYCGLYK